MITFNPIIEASSLERIGQEFVACEHCKGMRRKSRHPHAPRWLKVNGVYKRVDCRGVEVAP